MTIRAPRQESPASPAVTGSRHAWLLAFPLSLAVALAIISPFFWKGNASGHDFAFHAASWMDAAAQWSDGIFFPRWTDGANHGFGEPRFIFYPPLSWMLGAALSFVVPWIYVPAVFIVLTQTLAGLSAFALGRRLFPQRGALFCAVCYAANPYALLIIYTRSDFAEQLALAFFPLLLLATFEVAGFIPTARRQPMHSIIFFSLIFAAAWLTNAPAAVIASYSVTLVFAWIAILKKSWHTFAYGAAAIALGFALAGFYLLPAAYEQAWVNISQALSSGLLPSENFLYTIIADPEHNAFNRIASIIAVLTILLAGTLAAIVLAPHNKDLRSGPPTKNLWTTLLLLTGVSAFLMLRVSNIFWILLPKLRFVQFPWRWMSIPAVAFAIFAGAAITRKNSRWYWNAAIIASVAAVLTVSGSYMVRHAWWDSEDIPVLREALENDQGFEGTDEYDPIGDDHTALPEKSPRLKFLHSTGKSAAAPEAKFNVEHWNANLKEMRITSKVPLRVALRLLNYPAWRVEVNDAVVLPENTDETGQIIVPLPAGQSHLAVRFTRTPDRTIGAILSACGVLIAVILLIARRQE